MQIPDPATLLPAAQAAARSWRERLAVSVPDALAAELDYVLACSDFIGESLVRDPGLLAALDLDTTREPGALSASFAALQTLADETAVGAGLRRLRRRELVRIAWRDLTGRATLPATLADLSALADAAIVAAHAWAMRATIERYGTPRDAAGNEQTLLVIGMGKLGGGELNFSSDIDLIFLYPEAGETDRRGMENFEFFTRAGQKLIQLLDARTDEGFVFRVDMRLRPFGDSGPLVASFAALEDYLQAQGRDWERYAWIKARAITGTEHYAALFRDCIRPFVFRRYLDFGVSESLREMKALISRDVERRELRDHVKLGPGGIREIEFIVQVFQLIRGGNDPRLRAPSLLTVLPHLAGQKLLPESVVTQLLAAYECLRRVENRLQLYADEQTHTLPETLERRERLAAALQLPGWAEVVAALERHRDAVAAHFQAVAFGAEPVVADGFDLAELWAGEPVPEAIAAGLRARGIDQAEAITAALLALRASAYHRRLDDYGRKRLHTLVPRLLRAAAQFPAPLATLQRLIRVIESIGSRTAYLALLNENPLALKRLVEIGSLGDFLPAQVAAFPLLLDELVDQRLFDEPPTRAQFAADLDLKCAAVDEDVEREVEALRQFQRAAVFRVALFDLTDRLPLMQVSDRLTDIAELILDRAMQMAWKQLTAIYGPPTCGSETALRPANIAAVGYGKLGGMELGYSSDLDVVFLHDSAGEVQQTAGPKVIDNSVFFLRLGQKIVHLLSVHTAAGRLYEVDMRLRPSGKGGMFMTNIGAFAQYQQQEAWTWEHQALLHSRAVAGDPGLRAAFEATRLDVLQHHVRRDSLRAEVAQMRERMRRELSKAEAGMFDVKQDPGGVADIEFLAQYWVLRWADRYPPLGTYADTIRQLESVGSAALVDHGTIDLLVDAYRDYRRLTQRLSLEQAPPVVPAAPFQALRERVTAIWDAEMSGGIHA